MIMEELLTDEIYYELVDLYELDIMFYIDFEMKCNFTTQESFSSFRNNLFFKIKQNRKYLDVLNNLEYLVMYFLIKYKKENFHPSFETWLESNNARNNKIRDDRTLTWDKNIKFELIDYTLEEYPKKSNPL